MAEERVDVPVEDGYRTEYYGSAAIYSIKVVSEEIARTYALPERDILPYDEPIVPRAEYEAALQKYRQETANLKHQIEQLNRRLIAVDDLQNALGA